jgi:nucleoside-diphosphate-sugar epimerase
MKVLVAGGAGYIGSHVSWELLKAGHTVHIFDREPYKVHGKVR